MSSLPVLEMNEGQIYPYQSVSSDSVYTMQRCAPSKKAPEGYYSCNCMGWIMQKGKKVTEKTCKHLTETLGVDFEMARCGYVPNACLPKVEKPKKEKKEKKPKVAKKVTAKKAAASKKVSIQDEDLFQETEEFEDIKPILSNSTKVDEMEETKADLHTKRRASSRATRRPAFFDEDEDDKPLKKIKLESTSSSSVTATTRIDSEEAGTFIKYELEE